MYRGAKSGIIIFITEGRQIDETHNARLRSLRQRENEFRAQPRSQRGEARRVDLDIVNPYFRTADYKDELEAAGVNVIAQNLEGTTLDAPALTARMFSIFEESMGRVIVDVGGDDAGATALGRFSRQLNESGYDMLCVVNKFRKFISSPDEAVGLLGEIEAACRLKATGLVNNSHLGAQTTAQDILSSVPYAEKTAELARIYNCAEERRGRTRGEDR